MATILVVDDEQITRHLLRKIIEKRGYTCLLAESAQEARGLLEEQTVDLLVTDVMMPKETGLDLVRYTLPKYPDMAVIMVTGVESALFSEFAQAEGVYDYIQKPFESEDLLERIASALRRRKMKLAKVSYDGAMSIGLLKESAPGENRVALLPDAVALLISKGHSVYFQKNCGATAGHSNEDYRMAGGSLVEDSRTLIEAAQLVVKVKELSPQEAEALASEQVLLSFLKTEAFPETMATLLEKKVTTLALQRIGTADGRYPVLSAMSAVAGQQAILQGMQFLCNHHNGLGKTLAALPGIDPARLVVLGAGRAGIQAARMGALLGAQVILFELNQKRISSLKGKLRKDIHIAPVADPAFAESIINADMVVNTAPFSPHGNTHLIDRGLVRRMQPGSVIVDVTATIKGAIETIDRVTTHSDPVWVSEGVIHYAVANIPGTIAQSASQILSLQVYPIVEKIAEFGIYTALENNADLQNGLITLLGQLTCKQTAKALGQPWQSFETLLMADQPNQIPAL